MTLALRALCLLSLLFSGAIFGFFYAWVCSTMWGLDAADPRTAIAAMQAMNASVRNLVFAPAFFGTPVVLALTAIVAALQGAKPASLAFFAAAAIYLLGGLTLTMAINVPMNETLALATIPATPEAAKPVWTAYSAPWQTWNIVRTLASALALLLAGIGTMLAAKQAGPGMR